MESASALGVIAVIVLVLGNGFFVATEFAIVAVRRSRLEQLEMEGHPVAGDAKEVVGHLDAYIAATQLGITLASLGLGWIGKPALADLIDPTLVALFGYADPTAAHAVSGAIAFAVITALHIVFGELAPKGLALQRPEGTTLWVARPIRLFHLIFRWPIAFLNGIGNGTLRLLGLPPATGHEMMHSVEELRLLVTGMQQAGVVEASEARIAARAFSFADLTAEALMTPRPEVVALPIGASREEVLSTATASPHARLIVYEDSIDNVVGVVYLQDLVRVLARPAGRFDLRSLVRPVLTVPASKAADDVLDLMRTERRHIAVVIDEYGGTAGIVTLMGLVEGLLGRIDDESNVGEPPETPTMQAEPDGSVLLDGRTRLDEFEELTGIELPESVHENVETVAGLVLLLLGHIPDIGDVATLEGRQLRVEELDGRRIARVRLLPTGARPAPAAP